MNIAALGTFTFSQKKLDIGNNKFIMMQRPIFMLSERFAQTHNLQSTKYHVPGKKGFYKLICKILYNSLVSLDKYKPALQQHFK